MKTEQNTKTEGSFKITSKPKLTEEQIAARNKEPLIDIPSNITKVIIPKEETNSAQEQSATGVDGNAQTQDTNGIREEIPVSTVKEITGEVVDEKEEVSQSLEKGISDSAKELPPFKSELPENIEKLVSFMNETNGTIQDYVRLSVDYDNIDRDVLVKEYYKTTKPHLSAEEIDFLLEDTFAFDDDIDEEREIRRKKLAYKEEVSKAKIFLEETKKRYYDNIKLRASSLSEDQQKASDFFNRHKEDQNRNTANHETFKAKTNQLFNENFEGFDFTLGEKKFRYSVPNASQVAEKQSDIANFIGKFLGDDGTITDTAGYHKALYAGFNADKVASHFYEQGKADAIRDVVNKSNNTSGIVRKAAPIEGTMFGAYKVKSVSGADSSKLKIKKFNK
jgi:hypothetical protein